MAEDKPDSEEGVKEWLARRLGGNLPPRPRPTGPRPAPRPDPPITSPTPRPAMPRVERQPRPVTHGPRRDGVRPAPVAVGPAPRRPSFDDTGFVEAGRRTENEDTAELLDETAPSARGRVDWSSEPLPPRVRDRATPEVAADSRWGLGTTPDIEPFPGPGPGTTPPAPDAFTADERFPSPPRELLTSGSFSTNDLLPVGGSEPELSIEVSLEESLDLPDPFPVDRDLESDSDPVTRRIPPSEDEERKTGELDVLLLDVPVAGPYPTPTQEQEPNLPPVAAAAVFEPSETARLKEPPPRPDPRAPAPALPQGFEAPATPPPPIDALSAGGFQPVGPPDEFLFARPEQDTVVLPDEDEVPSVGWSSTGPWIVLGLVMGVVGFGLIVSLLVLWLWLLAS